ncbi:acetoin utilization protein AcuC [Candidatus Thorarchaeota archaeon]|nr:MAG: acetoin utilization protein AcuC [Candidatus Thorarchaeota archaeon]
MSARLAYPYSDALLQYEFKKSHPLKPERLAFTYELSKILGLVDHVDVIEPSIATREELELFHSPDYIDAVLACEQNMCTDIRHGLGTSDNPIFPKIYEASARYVGATIDGMKRILEGASNAFVISGGLHHAQRTEASGFCVFNDVAIAIKMLQKKRKSKVLYVDIDAHHGDGVQNAFYRSKEVLTISMHQSGKTLFPGTGHVFEKGGGEGIGYSVNVPVIPGASSAEMIDVLNEIIVPLFESFSPDLLVTQLGVDGHFLDPLAHLSYSSHGYERVISKLRNMAADICSLGWLAVGGGGYDPVNVARLWSLFLAVMLDEDIPQRLPEEFKTLCNDAGYTRFPEGMRDESEVVQQYFSRDDVALDLERSIRRVKELIFPYHGLA